MGPRQFRFELAVIGQQPRLRDRVHAAVEFKLYILRDQPLPCFGRCAVGFVPVEAARCVADDHQRRSGGWFGAVEGGDAWS